MSELTAEKEFRADLTLVSDILGFTEKFLKKAGLAAESFDILVSIEEWYINIVKHAYHGKDEGVVNLKLNYINGMLEIVMSDTGPAFDPHSILPPDKPDNVEKAQIGGLGILFIRNLMDETEYRRDHGTNIFTMRKKVQLTLGGEDYERNAEKERI